MGWSTLLKAGKWLGKGTKTVIEATGKAALHPLQTMKGAAVGAGAGYVGWKKLTTDDSVVEIVSDAVVGEKVTEKVSETIGEVKESLGGIAEGAKNTAQSFDGISNFISNTTNGNGIGMIGGFMDNLLHGNISGMSMIGLVMSAFLIFGRSGWLGKIAGVMLAMMMIGNNFQKSEIKSQNIPLAQQQGQEEPQEVHRMRR